MVVRAIYIITEYYSPVCKKEILSFATIWMDIESIMLREINQTEEDKYSMFSLTCRI